MANIQQSAHEKKPAPECRAGWNPSFGKVEETDTTITPLRETPNQRNTDLFVRLFPHRTKTGA
jgi:hypothetical protein